MPFANLPAASVREGFARPIVQTLFVATCLLSVVSFYTTQQGMGLYLSTWFSVLAALGIQISLVMVAWLVGFERRRSWLLIGVYIITALVSIAFSYVSLYNWFSSRERPAEIRRALYDELNSAAGRTSNLLAEADAKARQYVVALDEMTAAERLHGHVSKSGDADPYLDTIRQSVAKEAQAIGESYREGSGSGVRYTAFERHARLTSEALREVQTAQRGLSEWRASAKPSETSEEQLRRFRAAYDAVPWATIERLLGRTLNDRPAVPQYTNFVDQSASSQEELLRAFSELAEKPGGRNYFALLLAAFIDVVIFLLAFASGPYFHGNQETRWSRGGAVMDAVDEQVFLRSLLGKLAATPMGLAAVELDQLTPGEKQYLQALETNGLAATDELNGKLRYLIDRPIQQRILESLSEPGLPLRAAARKAAAGA